MNVKRYSTTFVLFFATAVASSSGESQVMVVREQPYSHPETRELVVRSQNLGRDFIVLVSTPTGPFLEPGKKLPAIYVLDGGYGIAGPVGQLMSWSGSISPAFVVSLSYLPGDQHRTHDLLHRPRSEDGSTTIGGGGAAFANFLIRELRPYLEGRFALDPNEAVLFGHSSAGLFAANVLASTPEAFAGFVIASPSTWEDPQVIAEVRKAASRGHGRKVFIAAAQHEPRIVEGANQLTLALSTPASSFAVTNVIFADATHVSYWPDLVPAAYRHVLPPSSRSAAKRMAVKLTEQELARIAGVYAIGDGRTITVTVRESRALAIMTGTPQTEIVAESPQQFFAPVEGFDVSYTFEGPRDEPARAVVLSLNGAKTRAIRSGQ